MSYGATVFNMKALILAAGHGKRLLPYTHSAPKHMLPLANKPMLQYIVEQVANSGIKELGIVVGYKKEQIMDYFGDGRKSGLKITYIDQDERLGISHAIKTAKGFVGNGPFIVLLGDNLFFDDLKGMLREHEDSGAEASIGIHEVPDPRRFGVAVMDGEEIKGIVEKPDVPPSNIATVGVYIFSSPKVFEVIKGQKPSKRGEYEIADTYNALLAKGLAIHGIRIRDRWKDTGRKEDMLEANRAILERTGGHKVESSAVIESTEVRAPCVVGRNCRIRNSKIGPYVSIGDNTRIENSDIENSIIGENCEIDFSEQIVDSIIGRFSKLIRKGSKKISFGMGENSEVYEVNHD
jgi:glucose-1-phosphate thymidylyltransferase